MQSSCPMKLFIFSLLAMSLMLLNSCIDGEEEVFIHADGSGRVKLQYQVPGMIFSDADAKVLIETIEREVGKRENLQLLTNRVENENGQKIIHVEIATDNVAGLDDDDVSEDDTSSESDEASKSDKWLHALLGDVKVDVSGVSAAVSRQVNLEPLLEEYLGTRGVSLLGESEFRYTVHLPTAVEQSNAHEVLNGGKTLKWRYLLRECKQKPIVMGLKASIPLPWWVYGGVGMAGVGVLLCGFWWVKKSAKKSIA